MAPNTTNKQNLKEARAEVQDAKPVVNKEDDLIPVKITHNYRPIAPKKSKILESHEDEDTGEEEWVERDLEGFDEKLNEDGKVRQCAVGEYAKVFAGVVLALPRSEARILLRKGRAQLHNEI